MTSHRFNLCLRSTLAATLLAASVVPAVSAADALPQLQLSGAVRYVTGGVGQRESQALLEHRRDYPLAVEIYAREGGRGHDIYTAGASVDVSKAPGDSILHAEAEGPFLFADLPPGRYTVEVTLEGETQRKPVTVGRDSTSRAIFVFHETRT